MHDVLYANLPIVKPMAPPWCMALSNRGNPRASRYSLYLKVHITLRWKAQHHLHGMSCSVWSPLHSTAHSCACCCAMLHHYSHSRDMTKRAQHYWYALQSHARLAELESIAWACNTFRCTGLRHYMSVVVATTCVAMLLQVCCRNNQFWVAMVMEKKIFLTEKY